MSHLLASVPDVTTFAANLVVFLAAITAAVVGVFSAIKKIKESWREANRNDGTKTTTVAAASIMETTTLLMWSESNRNVCEAMTEANKRAIETNSVTRDLIDEIKELRHELQLDRVTKGGRK